MKAGISNNDYIIHLSSNKELETLKVQNLETSLINVDNNKNLGKMVTMMIGDTDIPDGIEVTYFPEKRGGWKDIIEIRITLTPIAYERIRQNGHTCTRYNGSDMIDIFIK